VNGLDNFHVGFLDTFPAAGSAIDPDSYTVCGSVQVGVTTGLVLDVTCSVSAIYRYVVIQSVDTAAEKLCIAEVCVQEGGLCVHLLGIEATACTPTHPFNGRLSGTTRVSRYQKGKTNLDFTEASDSEWQWHQLGHMQVCISLQADNHASTPPLSFFTGRMPFLPPNQQCQSTEGQGYVLHLRQKLLLLFSALLCFVLPTALNSIIMYWCAVKKLLTLLVTNLVEHQVQAFSSRAG